MNRLKELRQERNLSTRALAEILNINYSSINHYENGRRDFSTDMLIKLSDLFNVSIDYFLGRTDEGIYAVLENSGLIIEFNHEDYIDFRKLNQNVILFENNKRIVKIDKENTINKYKNYVEKNADEITSIKYKYIK